VLESNSAGGGYISKPNLRKFGRRCALGLSGDSKAAIQKRYQQKSKIKKQRRPEYRKSGHEDQCGFSIVRERGCQRNAPSLSI
jgi:hypothetical protein